MGRQSMLCEEQTLPGPERQAPLRDGNHLARLRDRSSDVRGHVVGALGAVRVGPVAIRGDAFQPGLEVGPRAGVGVLLDQETAGGVRTEDRAQARRESKAKSLGHSLSALQSNHEGVLIDRIHDTLTDGTLVPFYNFELT